MWASCEEAYVSNLKPKTSKVYIGSLLCIIGESLSEPHERDCIEHVWIYSCLEWPLTANFKWAHSNISQRSILRAWSMWRPVEGYCQSAASV